MLRIIEFGLLAVTLLVIIGLIVSGSRSRAGKSLPSGGLDDDGAEAQKQSKTP